MCDRPALASIPELAEILKMRPATLYDIVRRRHLPVFRIGRAVRVDVAEILALLRVEEEG